MIPRLSDLILLRSFNNILFMFLLILKKLNCKSDENLRFWIDFWPFFRSFFSDHVLLGSWTGSHDDRLMGAIIIQSEWQCPRTDHYTTIKTCTSGPATDAGAHFHGYSQKGFQLFRIFLEVYCFRIQII